MRHALKYALARVIKNEKFQHINHVRPHARPLDYSENRGQVPTPAGRYFFDTFATPDARAARGRFVLFFALEFYWVDADGSRELINCQWQNAESTEIVAARARATIKHVLLKDRRVNFCVIRARHGDVIEIGGAGVAGRAPNGASPIGAAGQGEGEQPSRHRQATAQA
jgi:hypothetical protein